MKVTEVGKAKEIHERRKIKGHGKFGAQALVTYWGNGKK